MDRFESLEKGIYEYLGLHNFGDYHYPGREFFFQKEMNYSLFFEATDFPFFLNIEWLTSLPISDQRVKGFTLKTCNFIKAMLLI